MASFRFEGGREMSAQLQKLSRRVSGRVQRKALRAGGELIRQRMSENAPHDPTTPLDLKDEMTMSNARGTDRNEVAIAVGPSKRVSSYAGQQEFGNHRHGPQPYARPALDTESQAALTEIAASLWIGIEDAVDFRGRG